MTAAEKDQAKRVIAHYGSGGIDEFRSRFRYRFRRELDRVRPAVLVLSSEHCASWLGQADEIDRLRELLDGTERVRIVVYLREQADFLASRYSTALRAGATGAPAIPADRTLSQLCDYHALLNRWASVFGKQNILVRLFQQNALDAWDVVADFFGACDLAPHTRPKCDGRQNQSLDIAALELLASLNQALTAGEISIAPEKYKALLEALATASTGPRLRLSDEDSFFVRKRFQDSNQAVAEEYLGGRSPLFVLPAADIRGTQEFGSATKAQMAQLFLNVMGKLPV